MMTTLSSPNINHNILKEKAINTIKNINEWLNANKLLISMPKTCYSIFAAQNKTTPGYLNSIKIRQNEQTLQNIYV